MQEVYSREKDFVDGSDYVRDSRLCEVPDVDESITQFNTQNEGPTAAGHGQPLVQEHLDPR